MPQIDLVFPTVGQSSWSTLLHQSITDAQRCGDQSTVTAANWSGTISGADLRFPATHRRTLTGNTILSAMPFIPSDISGTLSFRILQSSAGTGLYTITWPTTVVNTVTTDVIKWGYGKTPPQCPERLGGYIIVHCFWDGAAWEGVVMGEY
jgi:hypothetical protein